MSKNLVVGERLPLPCCQILGLMWNPVAQIARSCMLDRACGAACGLILIFTYPVIFYKCYAIKEQIIISEEQDAVYKSTVTLIF